VPPESLSPSLIAQLERDVATTVGDRHRALVAIAAQNVGQLKISDPEERLVDDVQQTIHDLFIDTTWPTCPRHGRHPLWFHDGGWWCEQDAVLVAPLGALSASSAFGSAS